MCDGKGTYTSNLTNTGWRTKCHTIDCAGNTFLLLQKHLTSGTELILIGWKIVHNEEYVQCDHRFASQPLENETLAFVTTFRHKSSESARHNFTVCVLSCATFSGLQRRPENERAPLQEVVRQNGGHIEHVLH